MIWKKILHGNQRQRHNNESKINEKEKFTMDEWMNDWRERQEDDDLAYQVYIYFNVK